MTTLEALEARICALEDIQAITQLKHRYFRLLDQRAWSALRECFTADVETAYESGHYRFSGVDEVMRFLSDSLDGLTAGGRFALHLGHHPEIELLGENEARGRWTLHAPSVDRSAGIVGAHDSFYQDEYRKVDGQWRISRIGYETHTHASWPEPALHVSHGDEADSREENARAREAVGRKS